MRSPLRGIPVYPALLGAAFVLTRYLQGSDPPQVLPRPVIVYALVGVSLQIVLTLGTRNVLIGAYFAGVTLLLVADPLVGVLMVAAGTIPLILAWRQSRRIQPGDWRRLTAVLNPLALILLAINVGVVVARGGPVGPHAAAATPVAGAPDIYVLVLDGYPRADTLLADYEYDNQPFLASMESLGFEVADDAHSNYNATVMTLVSMLSMRPVQEVVAKPPRRADEERLLIAELNNGDGLTALRNLGYDIVTVPSGISGVSLYSADEFLDTGQVNHFEAGVARSGMTPLLFPGLQRTWFHHQARERIVASLDLLPELAGTPATRPRFVLAHVMSPHPPTVFAADGSPTEGEVCFPQGCDLWAELFLVDISEPLRGQVEYLNKLVHEAVAGVIQRSTRPAVIVVMSDHGRRHDLNDYDEMVRSLFLSYTPGHPGLFPADATPINVLPRILNAYAGTSIPLASEQSYVLDLRKIPTTGHFDLTPWPR